MVSEKTLAALKDWAALFGKERDGDRRNDTLNWLKKESELATLVATRLECDADNAGVKL